MATAPGRMSMPNGRIPPLIVFTILVAGFVGVAAGPVPVPLRMRGHIEFDDVHFTYPGTVAEALSGVSVSISTSIQPESVPSSH